MITGSDVLTMLLPNGGWYISGDEYEGIQFIQCEPITKAEYEAGFAQYDTWKTEQDAAQATAKAVLLERLGLTQEEFNILTAQS
jgi:hypothetical protein